jgi:hypothetical protein
MHWFIKFYKLLRFHTSITIYPCSIQYPLPCFKIKQWLLSHPFVRPIHKSNTWINDGVKPIRASWVTPNITILAQPIPLKNARRSTRTFTHLYIPIANIIKTFPQSYKDLTILMGSNPREPHESPPLLGRSTRATIWINDGVKPMRAPWVTPIITILAQPFPLKTASKSILTFTHLYIAIANITKTFPQSYKDLTIPVGSNPKDESPPLLPQSTRATIQINNGVKPSRT